MSVDRREEIERWVEKNIVMHFSRSDGPGGQNVNKRSTKVTAWFPVSSMMFLTHDERSMMETRLSGRLNSKGMLVIRVKDTRSQAQNREIAQKRAAAIILEALKEKKQRKKTRLPRAAKQRRLSGKRIQSEKKKQRGGISYDGSGEEW
ncbi:MAG: aminoacyl-tRNA hydrolase [Spirochaetes bacterium]|nr:aminoacyl-tRNA hydrolase [Spirochaetota bacterium]